jgi:hypothetical protein
LIDHARAILSKGILHLSYYYMTDVNVCYTSEINVKEKFTSYIS